MEGSDPPNPYGGLRGADAKEWNSSAIVSLGVSLPFVAIGIGLMGLLVNYAVMGCKRRCRNAPMDGENNPPVVVMATKVVRKLSLIEIIARMPRRDRQNYYNDLFRRIGNEIRITKDHIVSTNLATKNTSNEEIIGDDNGDEEKSPSVLILEKGVAVNESESFDGPKTVKHNGNGTREFVVHASCVICFEAFREDDTIVYSSETNSCPHVFHKTCMVEYLSKKEIVSLLPQKPATEYDPTCPTCRQRFCRLLPPLQEKDTGQDNVEIKL